MAEQRVQNFTEGPILGPLIRFQLPILGALFLQAFYGAVDLLIVGQFGTAADVSAVSTGSQLMQLIQNTITSMAMGTTILLGRHIGERKTEKSGQNIGAAIWEFGIVGIVLTALILAPDRADCPAASGAERGHGRHNRPHFRLRSGHTVHCCLQRAERHLPRPWRLPDNPCSSSGWRPFSTSEATWRWSPV